MPEADADFTQYVFDDTYLNMELVIPRDGYGPDFAKVMKRLRDKDRLPIDRAHNNQILDTRMYEVEYKDRQKYSLTAYAIAENLFAQVDGEGIWHVQFQEIFGHRYDVTEVKEQDALMKTHNGTKHCRDTTKGVEVLVQWKDRSTT